MKKLFAVQFAILILTISAMGFAATYIISSSHETISAASTAQVPKVQHDKLGVGHKRSKSWRNH